MNLRKKKVTMIKSNKFFNSNKQNVSKDSYLWNTIAGLLNAGQSILILMVISRTNGAFDAGIFSLAYATACLFLTIGNYGMRSYQVTDVSNHYTFQNYLGSRMVTSIAMMLVSLSYCLYGYFQLGYSINKTLIILVICSLKLVDSVEDVYHGMYQNKNRLDIAAKALAIRLLITIITLCTLLIITSNLLISCMVTLVISLGVFILFTYITIDQFEVNKFTFDTKKVVKLLMNSFGVFVSAFLALYIVNAPKYAIDKYLSQEMQAYYTFIAMPVFVVGLLNNFLYQPILTSLAIDWNNKNKKKFVYRIIRQLIIICFLTIGSIIGAYFLGIPVLSLLYNTNLSEYKMELLVLLLGGGILAISGFITIIITIIRRQKDLIIGYTSVSILAYILSPIWVQKGGITGASWIYTILISILTVLFGAILTYRIYKSNTK